MYHLPLSPWFRALVPRHCQSLGSQNDKLKSNYEAVRTELIHLREKHNTTRKQLLEAVESRVDADQRTETMVHKWKVQLEGRTRELEALQAKLVPQDLDMLRFGFSRFAYFFWRVRGFWSFG